MKKLQSLVRYNQPSFPSPFDREEFLMPFSSLFDEFFNDSFGDVLGHGFFDKGTYPKCDVSDNESEIIIESEIPGLTKKDVEVKIDNGVLQIVGQKQETQDSSNKKYIHRELKKSAFCRSFMLGDNIDKNKVDAKFENGILKITLPKITPDPKREEVKQIEIQ